MPLSDVVVWRCGMEMKYVHGLHCPRLFVTGSCSGQRSLKTKAGRSYLLVRAKPEFSLVQTENLTPVEKLEFYSDCRCKLFANYNVHKPCYLVLITRKGSRTRESFTELLVYIALNVRVQSV